MIFNKISSTWDEAWWKSDSFTTSSLYKINTISTSYGSFNLADYKDYYEIVPGIGTFQLVVTTQGLNSLSNTTYNYSFEIKIIDSLGRQVLPSDIVGPDIYSDSITFTSRDYSTYYVEITNSYFGNFQYAATLNSVSSGGGGVADTAPPLLISISPSDGATGVAIGANFVLTFNEAVKAGTGSFVVKSGATTVSTIAVTDTSQVTFSGSTVTINPTSNLDYSKSYTLTVASGVIIDTAGNSWSGTGANPYDFTTAAAVNNAPTLTSFGTSVKTSNEDAEATISLSDLISAGNEADADGSVTAFVVRAVSSGTLKIGMSPGSATAWSATNNTIDATKSAFWTPAVNANGTLNAFTAVAKDNSGAESTTAVQASVAVTAVNDAPTLTAFASAVKTTTKNTVATISLSDLQATGNEADVDGSVTSFVVKAVSSGTLKIGASAATAAVWSATNNTIDATKSAFWTPATNTTGALNAFTVVAKDNGGLESTSPIQAVVSVSGGNISPTLTSFGTSVKTSNEDAEATISLSDLISAGNEADADGSVTAFVVRAVSSGTLKIGMSPGSATAWSATNNTIDATKSAFWTPAVNANGTLNAFTAVAKDNSGAESTTAVQASVAVTAVNDAPTLTAFASAVKTTTKNTVATISLSDLQATGNEADVDGSVTSFVVKAVSSGTLKIGASAATAAVWSATNNTIDATKSAFWTPATNTTGALNAFTVVAKDNGGLESTSPIQAVVSVSGGNISPTLTSFGTSVKTSNEDAEATISLSDLISAGNEADADGSVTAFVVRAVSSGTLKIGMSPGSATAWSATNNTIDATKSAFWTPAVNANGTLNAFTAVAKDNSGAESTTAVQASVAVTAVNDAPTLTAFASAVKTTTKNTVATISLSDLQATGNEADVDGSVTSFVVKAVSSGTLKIGASAATAAVWSATNNTIDATKSAFWTPATNTTGALNAFTVVAKDNGGLESTSPIQAVVSVSGGNISPTLTSFGTSVKTSNEDAEATISLSDLISAGNEADADGSVTAFVVRAVSSGTLKIGMSPGSATAWSATNNTIDATKSAFWTPAVNANGTLNAFTAVAKDNSGAESTTAVQASVAVTAVNDAPTLTAFASAVKTTTKNTVATISLSDLQATGNEADVDGSVTSFVVKAVSSGTLKIGASAATAAVWSATNNTIDATKSAFWTPATNTTGALNAFTVVAKDNGGLESTSPIQAVVSVSGGNISPTLTSFGTSVKTSNEDAEATISLSDLISAGNEADADGSVTAFVVRAVSSGTLKIGMSPGSATAWSATNNTIDATKSAFWTPAVNANGTLNAFTAVAKDNSGAESTTAVQASVAVTAVNDAPTLTAFASAVKTTTKNTVATISLSDLQATGNEADVDGSVTSFVVKAVSSGTLKIGASAATAAVWSATNNTIDATKSAFWTPATNTTGALNAFTVVAKDNGGLESTSPIQAVVSVSGGNISPTLTSFGTSVKTSNEDAEATISLSDLISAGNEADADGSVTAFVVRAVSSGTLKIGMSPGSATAWSATNNTIDATKSAFWTPAVNANGTLNAFTAVAKDNSGAESTTAVQASVAVTAVNDAPTLTAFASAVKTTTKNTVATISLSDLQATGNEADVDGSVTSFVVKAVSSGTLKIGASAATAAVWSATNNTIDATKSAFWTPATNTTGALNAFTVVAKDNGGLESTSPIQAVVSVSGGNISPTLTSFGTSVKTSNEDAEATISLSDLISAGNEADADGSVTAFVVRAVSSGTLKIGMSPGSATAWSATNNTIDATKSAFWTPAVNANGTLNAFTAVAKDNGGLESASATQAKVTVKYELGTEIIDLGTKGKLINPIQVDGGKYFYFWDKNGNGVVDTNTQDSFSIYQELDQIFTKSNIGIEHSYPSKIDEYYRFSNINGVNVALPTINGGAALTDTNGMLLGVQPAGTSIGSSNASLGDMSINNSYDDLAAIWDAYNGVGTTSNLYGVPASWAYGGYWSSTPAVGNDLEFFASSAGTFRESNGYNFGYVAVELIDNRLKIGTSNSENLSGTSDSDLIYSWAGNDTLDGGAGADVMWGGAGDDTYYVDNASDQTNEAISVTNSADAGGADLVYSSVTRTLGNYLEKLTLTGTAAISGTGNGMANTLTGNSAANTLSGGEGNDTLNGGLGKDILTGGGGIDYFDFTTAQSTTNVDTITDFNSDDYIRLDNAVMAGLGATTGALSAAAFVSGAGRTTAADASDRVIYNTTTGDLYYDADGTGSSAAVKIALIGTSTHPALDHTDFLII